ncbi:hypothetical protein EZV62_025822 [Acer yangbiense]|uniref:Helicase C-terminal domain-containing protein n=1 Tax=Acer yangbiense TaxID=1000413 RepID=A0A5C7GZJ6_9ROSI|nr:hypothetical protein EZV62_025822 [Acer yangbiense]
MADKEVTDPLTASIESVTENATDDEDRLLKGMAIPCARLVVLLSILKQLFEREASQKIVLFFSTCDAVDFHYSLLHGNMKQEDRRTTFGAFQTEKAALLLSTDVASRGLDFPKVKCIIQYDSLGDATEYVHRVGRTARLGQRGDSLLFLQPIEVDYLQDLEKHGVSLAEYPLMKVLDSFPLYGQVPRGKKFVSVDLHPWVLTLQKALESFILAEPKMKNLAKDAFCSWVRTYTAHRGELKGIFMVKKLHLGHVAKSFALKEQPSLVGRSILCNNADMHLKSYIFRQLSYLTHSHFTPPPPLTLINSKIIDLDKQKQYLEALKLYSKNPNFPISTTKFTFPSLLKACASISNLYYGKTLDATISYMGLQSDDPYITASLIDMYVKCGSLENAVKMFDELCEREVCTRDVTVWNSMIDGYFRFGCISEGIGQFCRMQRLDVKPDAYSLSILLGVCDNGILVCKEGKQMHGYILRNMFNENECVKFLSTLFSTALSACGSRKMRVLGSRFTVM